MAACAATCGGTTSPLGISKLALAQKIIVSANIVAAIAKLMCLRIWVTSNVEVWRFAKNVCEAVHTRVSMIVQARGRSETGGRPFNLTPRSALPRAHNSADSFANARHDEVRRHMKVETFDAVPLGEAVKRTLRPLIKSGSGLVLVPRVLFALFSTSLPMRA